MIIPILHAVNAEYYLGYFSSLTGGRLSVILINSISSTISFTIEASAADYYYNGAVDSGSEVIVSLPFSVAVSPNDTEYKGIFLKADSNAIVVIGQNEANGSSDTFFAIPYKRSSVITEYVYYGISVPGYSSTYQSAILIVGTEDNTTMKLTVTQTATINTGNTLYTGREYSFVINRLQTFYIRSTGDLTGAKIITDKQASVFSGHELTQIPQGICCSDALIEQIPPVTSWGRVFYTMPLATRRSYTIKILASYNLTEIDLYCKNLEESHIINEESQIINEGQHYSKTLSQEYCVIQSTKPVMVVQFSHGGYEEGDYIGDPMMIIIPDKFEFSNQITITTISNTTQSDYEHYLNIIVLARYYRPDMIRLISRGRNISLNTQRWVPIKVKHTTEAYATQVNISEGVVKIFHANMDSLMTASVYGFTKLESYGHSGRLVYATGLFSALYRYFKQK